MKAEKKERKIMLLSFVAGLLFAIVEYGFSIFSSSQSVLMDAVYDATELVFIALIVFLTPLFYEPVSEKHPYGYFQIENIFLIIKGFMMLAVTLSVSVEIIESAIKGGNRVNEESISLFQLILGVISIVVFLVMRRMNRSVSSPTVMAELMEWKLDIAYSFGLSLAFFGATFLEKTPLAFLSPYFDQLVAVVVVLLMLPENIKILWRAMKDLLMFSPDDKTVARVKEICAETVVGKNFNPVFFDVTRTGRHMWVSVYFETTAESVRVADVKALSAAVNEAVSKEFENCTCELILAAEKEAIGKA